LPEGLPLNQDIGGKLGLSIISIGKFNSKENMSALVNTMRLTLGKNHPRSRSWQNRYNLG